MTEDEELPLEIIERAIDGDRAAFRRLYLHYNPTVRWAVGLRVHRWPALVPLFDDIVQDVWWKLTRRNFKLLRYYSNDRGATFSRFLAVISTRIGWRLAKRHLDHLETGPVDVHEADAMDFTAELIQADFLDRLATLVRDRLDPKDYGLFEGYYVHGEKLKDIGERLGMNENTAYQRHRRLQKKVRDLADELLGEASSRIPSQLVVATLAALFVLAQGGPLSGASGQGVDVAAASKGGTP